MSNNEFRPNWASAPGDTIADILHERDLSVDEFAQQIEHNIEDVEALLQGRATIKLATARQLEKVLGASVEFWMARDYQYQQDMARFNVTDEEWANEFPIEDMIRFGWRLPSFSNLPEKITAFLQFFNVPDTRTWNKIYAGVLQQVPFKISQALESKPASVAAWLRQGEIMAQEIECQPWDAKKFEESLGRIRSLTREKDPSKFIIQIKEICAESGVAVVIVRTPRGCPASGATKFLSKDKALLLLSFRHLNDGSFWFAFFHEAGHLVLHGNDGLFLEGTDTLSTEEEEEANGFAQNILIPIEFRSEFLRLSANYDKVLRFALKIGIAPGIVVGQLQHLGKIPHDYLNKLKRRYKWDD